ncbi:thioredoxin reductase [Halorubrum aidingense JCM 13560]|uniref:Thioredoxin reductase n=1 Tax=Halorubrum aidingense JCM 13560 TaxID=1230454 RepID=M0P9P1_9EURY|nr:FAD-dependent oxidoreductase [Halorubrum aidingense]EMA66872.1 thioredoxin reductase [Halorubrum aidingense JCM 13560]
MGDSVREVVVVGSGVAGLSAAVYAARADLAPVVVSGDEPGGQLTLTSGVENYLGFPEGVGGHELVSRGRDQAEQFGAEFVTGTVVDADLADRPFELTLSSGETLRARALIVASGASARTLGVPGEDELMGYGLSTCATCDGAFHRGNDVLVVGGGDAAMEEALFLTKFADTVTVAHRREELRSSGVLARRARDHEDIEFRWNAELAELHGSPDDGVTGATLVSHPDGYPVRRRDDGESVETERLDVQGVFYAIGHTPNTAFLEDTPVDLDPAGYVDADPETTATAVEGVFAAGDVADARYQQAISAAGTGAMAALDAEEYLDERAAAAERARDSPPTPTA